MFLQRADQILINSLSLRQNQNLIQSKNMTASVVLRLLQMHPNPIFSLRLVDCGMLRMWKGTGKAPRGGGCFPWKLVGWKKE